MGTSLQGLRGYLARARVAARVEIDRQRGARMLWAPVFLGAGASAYFLQTWEPPLWALTLAVVAAAALLGAAARFDRLMLFAAGLACLGYGAAIARAALVAAPVLEAPTLAVDITGEVVEAYGHDDGKPRVLIDLESVAGLATEKTPARARIALRKIDERPAPGSRISVKAKLTTLPSPVAPGSFDFARAAWFRGVGAYGYALGPPTVTPPADASGRWIESLRAGASQKIHDRLPGATGAIAAALTVGDRSEIPATDDKAMRDSSLAHVLSISGLHMAIIGMSAFGALRLAGALIPPLALRFNIKKWAALFALIASGAYLALSGASVPAQRSFIMIALVFTAMMLDRSPVNLRIVAIAAFTLILLFPESVVDPSFQMSFAAVTALVATFEAVAAWEKRRGPILMRDTLFGRILWALMLAVVSSLIAGLATAPFAAFHFNRIAFYGVVANVAAMPVISFVVMLGAGLTLLALPFGLEAAPLAYMGWGVDAMLWIAHETASWPGATGMAASTPDMALTLTTLGGLWLCLWRGRGRALGLAPIAAALVVAGAAPRPDILIDRDVKNVAVRAASGELATVSGRRARFAVENWLARDGSERLPTDAARTGREGVWTCEEGICAANVKGRRVGYMERAGNAAAACRTGFDLLIAARPIRACAEGLSVTPDDTAQNGAMAFYLSNGAMRIETVRDQTGRRPWTVWSAAADGEAPPP